MSDTPTLRARRAHLARALGPLSAAPEHEAELWLCRALGWRRAQLYARLDDAAMVELAAEPWAARLSGVPLAYVWGETEFYGLPLKITPAVLIPRPDTETLVAAVLDRHDTHPRRVLDLGTGSGAIALALQQARPEWQVWGVDRSPEALRVAQDNGASLGLGVLWLESDWFAALDPRDRWDVIVANPPYVAADDPHLPDLRHEPLSALVAAEQGLADLRLIVAEGVPRLHVGGGLYLEHGATQAEAVQDLCRQAGLQQVHSLRDGGGQLRVTYGQRAP